MPIDMKRHRAILVQAFLAGPGVIRKCLARMEEGKGVYERPGCVSCQDNRNYTREAEDEVADALNYLAMEYGRCGADGDGKRADLVAAIAGVLWQAHIGIQNLLGVDEDDS